jgi:hypothetical protein
MTRDEDWIWVIAWATVAIVGLLGLVITQCGG